MPAIPTQQARGIFTQMLMEIYRERPQVQTFLQSFFAVKESSTKYVSIEVQRGTEKVAVDVERGSEGNRNTRSRSTEKIFEPPLYREFFDATQLDLYNRLFGSTMIDEGMFVDYANEVVDTLGLLQDKINRAYELQRAQVLTTGIVTLNSGDNIDFKRKSASLVDLGSGNYWATSGKDPFANMETGCNFLRQVGKCEGGTFNAIMGSTAFNDFLKNDVVTGRHQITNFPFASLREQQRNATGASFHGRIDAGSYSVNIWTYPEFYDATNGTSTPYIDPKKVILLPENPRFSMMFAAVPQLIDEENPTPQRGAFVIGDYKDKRKAAHIYDIQSAGVAVPVAVDQIYTVKVVA